MNTNPHTPNLDDLLLDICTLIEPSDADRKIIDQRYHQLKTHLERPASALAKYLKDNESRIYAQGSVAISTTITSGDKDDRFDVDAIVEFDVPIDWPDRKPLHVLFDALQGFPNAIKIERNTRCVTIQFAFMHMDVTIMDPNIEPRPERIGDIFHSPDQGESYRVPSNPYGFSHWFRNSVKIEKGIDSFTEKVGKRRLENYIDRLQPITTRAADQDDLPPMIPTRMDAQQVIALKLLKKILIVNYKEKTLKCPPTIYSTKKASDCGFESQGLTMQLVRLITCIRDEMDKAIAAENGPDERNPTYEPDRINDRWPKNQEDRRGFRDCMQRILDTLSKAMQSDFKEIATLFSMLFGETISQKAVELHLGRRTGGLTSRVIKQSGTVLPASAPTTPSVAKSTRSIPAHNFHCEITGYDNEDN